MAVCLGGCFQSALPGAGPSVVPGDRSEPETSVPGVPQLTFARRFELFGLDGRCAADSWRLNIDEDGRSQLASLTTDSGEAQGDEYRVVVSLGGSTLELLRTDEGWSGFDLWHVFRDGVLDAWAVELPSRVEPPADLPSFRACASFEQWSLHELEGGTSHVEAVVDIDWATWQGDPRDFPLWLDVESDGRVVFHDNRLRLYDERADSGEVEGEVVSWDGTEGIVRVRNSIGLCSVADGEIIFRLVGGDEIHVMQSWFVVDTEDQDNDGDREERHLRRTRSVLTRSTCPGGLRR